MMKQIDINVTEIDGTYCVFINGWHVATVPQDSMDKRIFVHPARHESIEVNKS